MSLETYNTLAIEFNRLAHDFNYQLPITELKEFLNFLRSGGDSSFD